MKNILSAVIWFCCIFTCQAQGIDFVTTSWDDAVQAAGKSGKQIFLYAQAKSCRFCRQMEREVFTDPKVIDFYNARFISYKIDTEDEGAGQALAKQHGIVGYPTYLFFDQAGKKLHQSSAFKPAAAFMQDALNAGDPNTALFAMLDRYERGDKSTDMLFNLANALSFYMVDDNPRDRVVVQYLDTQSPLDMQSEKNLHFVFNNYQDFKAPATLYLLQNQEKFVPLYGRADVDKRTQRIITQTASNAGRANDLALMEEVRGTIRRNFTDTARVLAVAGIYFYNGARDWPNCAKSTLHYANTVGAADWQTMYETGIYLKYFAKDEESLKMGVRIMDKVLKLHKNYEHLCIYAWLQTKAGNPSAALKAAKEAEQIAKSEGEDGNEARELIAELGNAKK